MRSRSRFDIVRSTRLSDHAPTIAASSALLSGFADSITATLDVVNGINQAEESLLISKSQQLADSALASLSLLANQRASMVSLLQQLAGL